MVQHSTDNREIGGSIPPEPIKVNSMVEWKDMKKTLIMDLIIELSLVVMASVFFRFREFLTPEEALALGLLIVVSAISKAFMFVLKLATVTEI